jgi:hypothetical protein
MLAYMMPAQSTQTLRTIPSLQAVSTKKCQKNKKIIRDRQTALLAARVAAWKPMLHRTANAT